MGCELAWRRLWFWRLGWKWALHCAVFDYGIGIDMIFDAFSTNWTLGGALNGPLRIGFALLCNLDSVVGKTNTTCLIVYSLLIINVSSFGFDTMVMYFATGELFDWPLVNAWFSRRKVIVKVFFRVFADTKIRFLAICYSCLAKGEVWSSIVASETL